MLVLVCAFLLFFVIFVISASFCRYFLLFFSSTSALNYDNYRKVFGRQIINYKSPFHFNLIIVFLKAHLFDSNDLTIKGWVVQHVFVVIYRRFFLVVAYRRFPLPAVVVPKLNKSLHDAKFDLLINLYL